MSRELLRERIEVADYEVTLDEDVVEILALETAVAAMRAGAPAENDREVYITFRPTHRREAFRMSMALRRAAARLTEIGEQLPLQAE